MFCLKPYLLTIKGAKMLDFDHNATLCYQKNTENTQKNQKNKDLEIACKDYLEDKPKNKSLEKENIDK